MSGPSVLFLSLFSAAVLITYFVAETRRRREAQRTEFCARLLDRLGSAEDLASFLGSESGERLLNSLSPESGRPTYRILVTVRYGVVLTILAVTIFTGVGVGAFFGQMRNLALQAAILSFGLGAGLLVVAFASYVLAGRLGFVDDSQIKRQG